MAPPAKSSSLSLARLPIAARVGLAVAMLGLVGTAYFVLFYSDVSGQIAAQQRQEENLRQDLAKERQGETLYLADLAELTDKQQRQRELNKVLPEKAEYPAFLSAVQGVANVSGVALNSWDPVDESPGQFFSKVPMKLSLSGRFHQMAKFFNGIAQLDRIINLENISLSTPKREGDEVLIKGDCLATAFHALPAGSGSAAALAPPAPPTPAAPAAPRPSP